MLNELGYTLLSVILVSLLSLIGILTVFFGKRKLDKIIFFLISFSAGALLADAFLHLIPESVEEAGGFIPQISLFILFGIIFAFFIEKILHFGHFHHMEHHHKKSKEKKIKTLGYMNLIGDGIHNFVDGIIIGASYLVSIPLGIATTVAVIFHEIPQELGDFGILLHSGFNKKKALMFNFLSATLAIIGGLLSVLVFKSIDNLIFFLLPFAAGNFIYIASSNIIPELQKEPRFGKSMLQLLAILIGVALMYALLFLE